MGAISFVPSPKINWPQNGHFAQKYAYLAYLGLAGSFKALLVGWVLVLASEIDISVLKLLGFCQFFEGFGFCFGKFGLGKEKSK